MENIVQGQWFRGPSADLGAAIDQSLRFDGGSNLSRTFGTPTDQNKWTYSCWIKRADVGSAMAAGLSTAAASYGDESNLEFNAGADLLAFGSSNGSSWTTSLQSDKVFRDSSAWYHLMAVLDTDQASSDDRWKWYVNGTQITSFSTNTRSGQSTNHYTNSAQSHTIGSRADNSLKFDGYMAMVIFVDGQALGPTDFGKVNDDGVWVPQNYTGTYGNNGYKLTFDSSQTNGIGHDSSGNGNNWTATGFDEYSADVKVFFPVTGTASTAALGTTLRGTTPNGNGGTSISVSSTNHMDVDFGRSATSHTLTITNSGGGVTIYVSPDGTANSWVASNVTNATFTSGQTITASNNSSFRYLRFTCSSFTVNNVTAPVGGNVSDIDFFDTPTNNYCLLNPLLGRSASLTFEEANLRAQYGLGGAHANNMTFGLPPSSGKWYWEVTLLVQKEGHLGVVSEDYDLENDIMQFGQNAYGWAYFTGEGVRKNNNVETGSSHTIFQIDDTVGFLLDTTAGTLTIEINGVAQTSGNGAQFTNIPTDKTIYPFYYLGGASGDANLQWNFGQHAFQQEPTGYQHIATNNLPEPTIKNGKEHFGVLTYTAPASPSFPITIDGSGGNNGDGELDFDGQPDLVWIKMRNGGQNNILFDTVRGATNSLRSDDNIAEVTTRSNFAFATNGFTFSAQDAESYQQNDNYVAWCWKAGGTAVSNTNGTITSSVSANTDAGFSIVSYTGTGANATIGHGLTEAPDLVIYKRRDATSAWPVYNSTLLSATEYLQLDSSATKVTGATTVFNSLRPTNSVLNVGTSTLTNSTGTYVAYCWHSVPGFSKINYYQGNGNSDGPFIYTGFKVSFLIIKSVTTADWFIYDAGRFPNNSVTQILRPNAAAGESGTGNDIDFLANGFKIRNTGISVNSSGTNYLYMAFAENPFGGKNQPPATAR